MLPESTQHPRFDHPAGAVRVAAGLGVEETVVEEEVVVEVAEVVVDDEIVEEVVEEDALDEVVEVATVAVVTELSPMAAKLVMRHDPPHLEYMSPWQTMLHSLDATSLAVER